MEDSAKLVVAVRIRPISEKELSKDNVEIVARALDDKTVLIVDPMEDWSEDVLRQNRPREKIYAFDQVFSESSSQLHVYERTVRFLIPYVLQGYNSTVFAYGATGAGKTFTMLGTDANPGIMALTLADLFNKIERMATENSHEKIQVSLSYLEIYNENIRDLLSGKPDVLDLRDDGSKGVVVAGITSVTANSAEEVMMFLRKGNRNRSQEPTGANEVSSRSHAILQVLISSSSTDSNGPKIERFSKLSMIDLAGSERAAETNNRGQRMIEGANINRSLLALGNCINALIDGKRGKYVNYRDSKLTRLLKDSLGGNCRTVMISNISPASTKFDETLNTLKYASRARNIKNKITQQVKIEEYSNAVNQMRAETTSLKVRIANNTANAQKENNAAKHNRTRTQTTDTMKSTGIRWTDNKRSAVSTAVFSEDNFYEYLDSLEINMGDQIALKNKIVEEDELEAAAIGTSEQLQVEIEKLNAAYENSSGQQADKRKAIESQINSKKKALHSCEQSTVEIQQKKASIISQINELQEKVKENGMSINSNLDSRGRQYIDLRLKTHSLELENIDLWLYYNLASAALVQKEDESHVLYDLIRLYEEIIAELMKDRPAPPDSLKTQFRDLNELKTNLDIFKIDEKSTERMRRKIQLICLGDRIAQSTQDKDTISAKMADSPFLPPKNKSKSSSRTTSKTVTDAPKKQNIFSAGLAKILGKSEKNQPKPTDNVVKEPVHEVEIPDEVIRTEDILTYNLNVDKLEEPLEKKSSASIISEPSKSVKISKGSIASPENIVADRETQENNKNERFGMPLAESQFSKSLMMLEKQVETLNNTNSKVANIDYLAEFKSRNQERVAKLYSETPNSDRTLSVSSKSLLHEAAHSDIMQDNLQIKPASPSKPQLPPLTDSEKKVEQKRLKEAQKLELYGSQMSRNNAIQQAYGIKTEGHSKIHPVLHKATDRSRRNTTSVKHG